MIVSKGTYIPITPSLQREMIGVAMIIGSCIKGNSS